MSQIFVFRVSVGLFKTLRLDRVEIRLQLRGHQSSDEGMFWWHACRRLPSGVDRHSQVESKHWKVSVSRLPIRAVAVFC